MDRWFWRHVRAEASFFQVRSRKGFVATGASKELLGAVLDQKVLRPVARTGPSTAVHLDDMNEKGRQFSKVWGKENTWRGWSLNKAKIDRIWCEMRWRPTLLKQFHPGSSFYRNQNKRDLAGPRRGEKGRLISWTSRCIQTAKAYRTSEFQYLRLTAARKKTMKVKRF